MPCCGKRRAEFQTPISDARTYDASRGMFQSEPASVAAGPLRVAQVITVEFEYTGDTGLTVQGPITGRRYRFGGPGAKVAVDGRDAASVAGVPNLKRVRNS